MRSSLNLTLCSVALAVALTACGGGGDAAPKTGVFLDSPVAGMSYVGNRGSAGVTSAQGEFTYQEGETITFRIGGLTLGSATGGAIVTPAHLESTPGRLGDHAARVLRVLQTLDSDDNPENGITVSTAARAAITQQLDLSTSAATEAAMLAAVRQAKPAVALQDEDRALQHFAQTLIERGVTLPPPPKVSGSAVTLSLMHTNDTHSRIESFTENDVLQGGVARRKTLVNAVRTELGAGGACPNTMLVDAGDFSQGTVFYNAWEGSESVMAMNDMQYDVATLGNHEFDLGPAKLARAIKGEPVTIGGINYTTEEAKFSVVATNLDVSKEPALQGLLKKFKIIERCGQKYGLLGVTTSELPQIASPGPNVKVLDYVKSVNTAANMLKARGINKIILLSHYGYAIDIQKVAELSGVDVVVSAHDHKLLGLADYINAQTSDVAKNYAGQGAQSAGDYPTLRKDRDGNDVRVVSAYEWGRWLGRLDVSFDADGKVVKASNQSKFVDGRSVPEDTALATKVTTYKAPVLAFSSVLIGSSDMAFSAARGTVLPFTAGVRTGETLLGNLILDLMQQGAKETDGAVAAFSNGGGLRADIKAGNVTFGDALAVLPFGNTLFVMDLKGQDVIDLMEASVGKVGGGGFLQHSKDLRMAYCVDATQCASPLKAGGRVTAVQIAGVAVDPTKTYRLATNNFTGGGGDGYAMLKAACERPGNYCRDTGVVLLDLLVKQLKTGTPLSAQIDGRITRVQ